MTAFFSSLGRTVLAGFVLVLVLIAATGTLGRMGEHAWWAFVMRWLHIMSGILWVGLLYYFNFVQTPSMPKIPDEQKPAVGKVIAPTALFWFRWAALATVVLGLMLAGMKGKGYVVNALTFTPGTVAIGIGMWLALIMAFNVWFIIWPAQKKILGGTASAEELPVLGWTWLYFYAVLASYYVVRPIRDEAGVAGGVDNLPWLFTGTLIGMALANPAFSILVARLPRRTFVSWTYRFFILNLLLFFVLFKTTTGDANIWVGRAFYIWTAIFNLFVVSVFWALMVDVFNSEQGKRLFGFIAAGATLGAIAGSATTAR